LRTLNPPIDWEVDEAALTIVFVIGWLLANELTLCIRWITGALDGVND